MIKDCRMRHENGNCLPAGGFAQRIRTSAMRYKVRTEWAKKVLCEIRSADRQLEI